MFFLLCFIVKLSISREKFYLQCFTFHHHPRLSNLVALGEAAADVLLVPGTPAVLCISLIFISRVSR